MTPSPAMVEKARELAAELVGDAFYKPGRKPTDNEFKLTARWTQRIALALTEAVAEASKAVPNDYLVELNRQLAERDEALRDVDLMCDTRDVTWLYQWRDKHADLLRRIGDE